MLQFILDWANERCLTDEDLEIVYQLGLIRGIVL